MKNELLSRMGRELRVPVDGVINTLEMLANTQLPLERQRHAQSTQVATSQLLNLINDIYEYSDIEAGRLPLQKIGFDVRECIDAVLTSAAPLARAKGLSIQANVSVEKLGACVGDPGRLRQALSHLIGNAIKFTDRGEVLLSATVMRRTDERAQIRFAITDTGIGIEPGRLPYLFYPPAAAANSTKGFGLIICKELVNAMGGHLELTSQPGSGSTFSFTLDLATIAETRTRAVFGRYPRPARAGR